MPDFQLITDQLHFPEGPVATSHGSVILVEIQVGRLSEVDVATGSVKADRRLPGGTERGGRRA